MNVASDWDNDYARIARAASQLRTLSSNSPYSLNNINVNRNPAINKESILTGLDRLTIRLRNLEQSRSLSVSDLGRRRLLIHNLSSQLISENTKINRSINMSSSSAADHLGIGYPSSTATTTVSSALRQQDDMIDELASGIGRLKDQSKIIGEEAKMHVSLLDQMDVDVEKANESMENETRRALKLKEDKSVWRLHLIIAGLSVLLFIFVLSGLS